MKTAGSKGAIWGGATLLAGLLAVFVSAPFAGSGCHGAGVAPPADSGAPSSLDAGDSDAAPDRDASEADAGIAFGDAWVPLEGAPALPDGCHIERALNPSFYLTPRWRSCGEGCLELEKDSRFPRRFGSATYANGELYFFGVVDRPIRTTPHAEDQEEVGHGVLCSGSDALFAVRVRREYATPRCGFDLSVSGEHAIAYASSSVLVEGEPSATIYTERLPGSWSPVTPDTSVASSASLQWGHASDVAAAYVVQPSQWVMMIDAATGGWRRLSDLPGRRDNPQNPRLVGDHLIWEAWGSDRIRLVHATVSHDTTLFYEIPDDPRSDARGMATDGIDIAWLQGYGRPCVYGCPENYARLELWTAHYTRDPDQLRPRFVGNIGARPNEAFVAGGRYAMTQPIPSDTNPRPNNEALIMDLADGRQRTWSASDGWRTGWVLALSPDEVVVLGQNPEDWTDQTLFRVRIDSIPYE